MGINCRNQWRRMRDNGSTTKISNRIGVSRATLIEARLPRAVMVALQQLKQIVSPAKGRASISLQLTSYRGDRVERAGQGHK